MYYILKPTHKFKCKNKKKLYFFIKNQIKFKITNFKYKLINKNLIF